MRIHLWQRKLRVQRGTNVWARPAFIFLFFHFSNTHMSTAYQWSTRTPVSSPLHTLTNLSHPKLAALLPILDSQLCVCPHFELLFLSWLFFVSTSCSNDMVSFLEQTIHMFFIHDIVSNPTPASPSPTQSQVQCSLSDGHSVFVKWRNK